METKMIPEKDFKYYVVELLEDALTDKYVCIPSSWMKFRETPDGEVLIKYPEEKISVTKKRVKKGEESLDNWPIHLAEIKLGTNSYKEATNYIKILKKILKQEQNSTKTDDGVSSTCPNGANQVQTISALLSDDVKPVSTQVSEQGLAASKECQEKSKVEADSSTKTKRYFTRQTNRMSSPANTSMDQTVEKISQETSNCFEESVNYNQNQDSLVNCSEVFTDVTILQAALEEVLGDNYKEILGMIYAEHEKRYNLFKILCNDSLQHCKAFKELIELSGNASNGQEVIKNKKQNITLSEIQNNYDDMEITEDDMEITEDNIESTNNNPSDKIRGQARKFTLPPEYDPENSKWTLKHRKYKEGLVELIPQSHIYVDAIQLSNCKRISKDSKTLARMLLLEVFRKSALCVCSLTGKRANAFDLDGTTVRPGLDEHARNVLLNFVEQHAIDQKWVFWDRPTILNSLRNKVQEMRGKYG